VQDDSVRPATQFVWPDVGLPDELTYLLITNQLGDRKSKQSDPASLFRGLARFWSLAYSMTKPKNAPAADPSSKEAGDA
jgi:hypothetical protein